MPVQKSVPLATRGVRAYRTVPLVVPVLFNVCPVKVVLLTTLSVPPVKPVIVPPVGGVLIVAVYVKLVAVPTGAAFKFTLVNDVLLQIVWGDTGEIVPKVGAAITVIIPVSVTLLQPPVKTIV